MTTTQDSIAVELQRLWLAYPKRVDSLEEINRRKESYTYRINKVCRRDGIIIPTDSSEFVTNITTTPPQFGLNEEYKNLVSSQINTYEIGE